MNPKNVYYDQNEDEPWQNDGGQVTEEYEDPFEQEQLEEQGAAYQPNVYEDESLDDVRQPAPRQLRSERKQQKAAVISTNATINLTCTICAASGLFGLFLFFVEKRSRVIRRFAVQSASLFSLATFLSIGLAVLAMLFGYVPFIGGVLAAIVWILFAVLLGWSLYQRVRLMAHAYRGEAFVLPLIGKYLRQFE